MLQNVLKSLPKDGSTKGEEGKAGTLAKMEQASERVKGLKRKVTLLGMSEQELGSI